MVEYWMRTVNAVKKTEDDRMVSGEWREECQEGNRAQEALAESVGRGS